MYFNLNQCGTCRRISGSKRVRSCLVQKETCHKMIKLATLESEILVSFAFTVVSKVLKVLELTLLKPSETLKWPLCVIDSGSRLSTLFSQPHHQPLNPHTNSFGLCCHNPNAHTSGLTHGRGRGCSGGLRSRYHSHAQSWTCCPHVWKLGVITLHIHFVSVCLKGPRRNLRNDLLIAADSITNTMSSLVKELNSGENEWMEAFPFWI